MRVARYSADSPPESVAASGDSSVEAIGRRVSERCPSVLIHVLRTDSASRSSPRSDLSPATRFEIRQSVGCLECSSHPETVNGHGGAAAVKRTARRTPKNMTVTIKSQTRFLNPIRTAWTSYFRKAEVRKTFEDLDQWIRRKLRAILWRQWKRPWARARELMRRGLDRVRAWVSATNGHGPWWNAGASHMNHAVPNRFFGQLGLISLLQESQRLARSL
jgi:hypothetical protein